MKSAVGASGDLTPAPSDRSPQSAFPGFGEEAYLAEYADVREGVARGDIPDGLTHYLRHGVDENRNPRLTRDPVALAGNLEACFVSESGSVALLGWIADEGRGATAWTVSTDDFQLDIPIDAVFRFARKDVEVGIQDRAFDYGFLALASTPSATLLQQKFDFRVGSRAGAYKARAVPDIVADHRLVDLIVNRLASAQAYRGAAASAHDFLAGSAGRTLTSLFRSHVARHIGAQYVERFRPRRVERSFVVILFESAEPILLQPLLFGQQGVRLCEWIYVCNSRQDGDAALQFARMMSELYDVMITVIVMSENVGFSAGANAAVAAANSACIYLMSAHLYPAPGHGEALRGALEGVEPGDRLVGGLLFHDARTLAQSGLYVERDAFVSGDVCVDRATRVVRLARLKSFDCGAPFEPEQWRARKRVPIVSSKFMAFDRGRFESLGGFSGDYVYGGYEDADLALRWADRSGPPVVDPGLRATLVDAGASQGFAATLRSARTINRHLFSLRYGAVFDADPAATTTMREDG